MKGMHKGSGIAQALFVSNQPYKNGWSRTLGSNLWKIDGCFLVMGVDGGLSTKISACFLV